MKHPITLIAGPCSAETEQQVMTTATALARHGITTFRAGIWKPRTRPGNFEGVGVAGLPWLQRVQQELGMKVVVEVGTPAHVEAALKAGVDMVWIGARTSANPFAVQAVAEALRGSDIPVLVKNPINPDLSLWLGAIERLSLQQVTRLSAVLRGFSCYGPSLYRNPPLWEIALELRRQMPQLPILCDPSHICGRRDLIADVCRQALDHGLDGLMIESHCTPDAAWSDAAQQVTPDDLAQILADL